MFTGDGRRIGSRILERWRAGAAGIVLVAAAVFTVRGPVAILGRPLDAWRVVLFAHLLLDAIALPVLIGARRRARRRTEEQLYASLHDELTGLANRALFRDRAEHAIAMAGRRKSGTALVLVDMEHFKDINSALGHDASDQMLLLIAARLGTCLRDTDTLARFGADQFAIVAEDVPDQIAAGAIVRRIGAAFVEPLTVDGNTLLMKPSIGVAICPQHGDDVATLLQRAHVALDQAKDDSNQATFYDARREASSVERVVLVNELRVALACGEIVAHFQPKADMRTGRTTGVEALARWNHPQRGLVAPGFFLPAAEAAGLLPALTDLMLTRSLAQCRLWLDRGWELQVAVNLAAGSLDDLELPRRVETLLKTFWVPPHLLELEITETSVMTEPERAIEVLTRLRDLGVRVAIDDFGTGYSSLAYLKRFPIDTLKVDRSFVMNLTDDTQDRMIFRSTMELAHNLGFEVVAEGVEDRATWDHLVQEGCDLAQGYYIARPQPGDVLTAWLDGQAAQTIATPY
jgi:diguanylate cyclase (GGDEF)-like protein